METLSNNFHEAITYWSRLDAEWQSVILFGAYIPIAFYAVKLCKWMHRKTGGFYYNKAYGVSASVNAIGYPINILKNVFIATGWFAVLLLSANLLAIVFNP